MAAAYRAVSDDAESFGFGWAFLVRTGSPSGTSPPPFFSFHLFLFVSIDTLFHVGWKSNNLGRLRSKID